MILLHSPTVRYSLTNRGGDGGQCEGVFVVYTAQDVRSQNIESWVLFRIMVISYHLRSRVRKPLKLWHWSPGRADLVIGVNAAFLPLILFQGAATDQKRQRGIFRCHLNVDPTKTCISILSPLASDRGTYEWRHNMIQWLAAPACQLICI